MVAHLPLDGKSILLTGGTGSLGRAVVRRLLRCDMGTPAHVVVFSRDEGKHHQMRQDFVRARGASDDLAHHDFERTLEFWLGDVRDYDTRRYRRCTSAPLDDWVRKQVAVADEGAAKL